MVDQFGYRSVLYSPLENITVVGRWSEWFNENKVSVRHMVLCWAKWQTAEDGGCWFIKEWQNQSHQVKKMYVLSRIPELISESNERVRYQITVVLMKWREMGWKFCAVRLREYGRHEVIKLIRTITITIKVRCNIAGVWQIENSERSEVYETKSFRTNV